MIFGVRKISLNRTAHNLKYTKNKMHLEAQKSLYMKNTRKHLGTESKREGGRNSVQFRASKQFYTEASSGIKGHKMLCSQQFGELGTPHHITYPDFSHTVDEETEAPDHLLKFPKLQSGRSTVLLTHIQGEAKVGLPLGGGETEVFWYYYLLSIVLFSILTAVSLLLPILYCVTLF